MSEIPYHQNQDPTAALRSIVASEQQNLLEALGSEPMARALADTLVHAQQLPPDAQVDPSTIFSARNLSTFETGNVGAAPEIGESLRGDIARAPAIFEADWNNGKYNRVIPVEGEAGGGYFYYNAAVAISIAPIETWPLRQATREGLEPRTLRLPRLDILPRLDDQGRPIPYHPDAQVTVLPSPLIDTSGLTLGQLGQLRGLLRQHAAALETARATRR